MRTNKRAQIGLSVLDFWAFIIFLILLLVFILIMPPSNPGQSKPFTETAAQIDTQIRLLNFVRLPDETGQTFADLVALNQDGNLDSQLELKATQFLEKLYGKTTPRYKLDLTYFDAAKEIHKSFTIYSGITAILMPCSPAAIVLPTKTQGALANMTLECLT